MPSIFMTGYPGFLGSALVERLLDAYPQDVGINCLVQPAWHKTAEERTAQITAGRPNRLGRIRLLEGDITRHNLGLEDEIRALGEDTLEIFHLAAVYDLAVEREFAMRVNVEGTHNMLSFAEHCPNLRRFQYTSTCYVSGRYPGVFFESDLHKGQKFNNYYEETKHLAEAEVQNCMQAGMPATIYRPSIVTGDSRTGGTQKYDGLYFVIQLLLRQPASGAMIPMTEDPERFDLNVVPSDYVVDAIAALSLMDRSLGKVYQLADPKPLNVEALVDLVGQATGRRVIKVPVPRWVAKTSLRVLPPMQRLMRIEPETVDYFTHPTTYHTTNAQADLQGTGIRCPRLPEYIDALVAFMQVHPEVSAKAMV